MTRPSASSIRPTTAADARTPLPDDARALRPPHLPADRQFLNRDLSWIEFNRRVLALAADPRTPLLERVRFLAIFSNNLDEFFMKRVGLIRRELRAGRAIKSPDGLSTQQQFHAIRSVVRELQEEQADLHEQALLPDLAEQGINILRYVDLTTEQRKRVDRWYRANVFPVLTPLAVDPGHRFPFISNLSENLGILLSSPSQHERQFARVKIPDVLPRFVRAGPPDQKPPRNENGHETFRFVPLDEIIAANLDDLFPGMTIHEVLPFRVTRSAAIEREDEDVEDLLEHVEAELRMRRFASVCRIEVGPEPSQQILQLLKSELGLDDADVYERRGPLEYTDLFTISDLDRPDLRDPPWSPVPPAPLADEEADIFAVIRERDLLLHHPYHSFNASVERFIAQAARDPDVLAIKQTIYRTSPDSPFVSTLIRAAEAGKQVACLVELRARFDEQRNVRFARQLEKHGVHVAYGIVGLKTHCKTSLVVRREGDDLRCYAHIGTGNYHPKTAQLYSDIGLLTCDPDITEDAVTLFNELTGRAHEPDYEHLVIAPYEMRNTFTRLINREIRNARAGGDRARNARIIAKMNALEDTRITKKLYEASQAGVQITLIVRGFCCLRPGVPGLSENITVLSAVGRFLEHSRIFYFRNGKEDPTDGDFFISSADWMYRNLNNRVEAACPVRNHAARAELYHILDTTLRDHRNVWVLNPDGTYTQRTPPPDAAPDSTEVLGTFETLMRYHAPNRTKA